MAAFDNHRADGQKMVTYQIGNVCHPDCGPGGCTGYPTPSVQGCVDCKANFAMNLSNVCEEGFVAPTASSPAASNTNNAILKLGKDKPSSFAGAIASTESYGIFMAAVHPTLVKAFLPI
jgi:hypothetical protein